METAVIGGGCFWCTEALFKQLRGVNSVVSGYAGGHTDNPSYDKMHSEHTGHAEVVQVTFDPKSITYKDLLEIFYANHDPTTKDRQGNDVGPEYRSIVLYANETQKKIAEEVTKEIAKLWDNPIVTEIVPLDKFWPAEDYHQDFFTKNPELAYCQVVINPKLEKFRKIFADKLVK